LHKKHSKAIATSKQSYKYLLYTSFSESFSDVAQHNGTSCVPKGAINGPQTTVQGKEGCLITVMDGRGVV